MRTADNPGVRLPGLVQVVRVAAFAAEQYGVFGATHRLADLVHGPHYCKSKMGTDPIFLITAAKSGSEPD
jgi:hypothetical protein